MRPRRELVTLALRLVRVVVGCALVTVAFLGTSTTQRAAAQDDWPGFHHDLANSGYSTSVGPEGGSVYWSHATNGDTESPPTVVDGMVYFGCRDGQVRCLDAVTGETAWAYNTSHEIWYSAPAVADGNVYIGTLGGGVGYVFCLDADTGAWKWAYETEDNVTGSAAVFDGKVYIGCWGGYVYCLDAATGDRLWYFDAGDQVWATPAIADGRLYIGSTDFWCLPLDDPDDDGVIEAGEIIWTYDLPDVTHSSAAVVDGQIYVGCDDNKLYCLDEADNGDGTTTLLWTYTTNGQVHSSPALWENFQVYFGSDDGRLYCVNTDGDFVWARHTDGFVRCSPAVADQKVYFTARGNDFDLYCLEADDGAEVWVDGTRNYGECSPALWDGKLYVGNLDDELLCFADTMSGSSTTMSWSGGTLDIQLDAGPPHANDSYIVLSGLSGTSPGFDLFLTHVHLNWDIWTSTVLRLVNSVLFVDFLGTLDDEGRALAQFDLVLPLDPSVIGLKMYFTYLTLSPKDFAGNAIAIEFE